MQQEVEGWYGQGGIELVNPAISKNIEDYKNTRADEVITIIKWHKRKDTGEPYTSEIKFFGRELYGFYEILKQIPIGEPYKAKYFWKKLIEKNNLQVVEERDEYGKTIRYRQLLINEFNGGSNRKIYFRYYYGPARLLESWRYITFSRE